MSNALGATSGIRLGQEATAREAIAKIDRADFVVVGFDEPQTLLAEIVAQRERLDGLRLLAGPITSDGCYAGPEATERIRVIAISGGPHVGTAMRERRFEYLPCAMSELANLAQSGVLPVSVVLLHVAAPDEDGFCVLGTVVDHTWDFLPRARLVIAECNEMIPRTVGANRIHRSAIDYLVHSKRQLPQVQRSEPGPVERAIAEHVASLVPDGSTLQFGIGKLPDAIAGGLGGKRDLGVHSGLLSPMVRTLMEAGVVTNRKKALHTGVTIGGRLLGTDEFYAWTNGRRDLEIHPLSYTNDAKTLGALHNLVALDSALQADLTGQVNAESIDGVVVGAVGGQVEFLRAAMHAPEGRAIVALPSATSRGETRIVATFNERTAVTTLRTDVQFIVTEHGIADLRGRTLPERALSMIQIAHPDARPTLRKRAAELLGV